MSIALLRSSRHGLQLQVAIVGAAAARVVLVSRHETKIGETTGQEGQ